MSDSSYFEEIRNLDPALRHALDRVLRVSACVAALEEVIEQIPAIDGEGITLPEDWTRPRLDIHPALLAADNLPPDCQHTVSELYDQLADAVNDHNNRLEFMESIVGEMTVRFDNQCADSAHRWAVNYIANLDFERALAMISTDLFGEDDDLMPAGPSALDLFSGPGPLALDPRPAVEIVGPVSLDPAPLSDGIPVV